MTGCLRREVNTAPQYVAFGAIERTVPEKNRLRLFGMWNGCVADASKAHSNIVLSRWFVGPEPYSGTNTRSCANRTRDRENVTTVKVASVVTAMRKRGQTGHTPALHDTSTR